VARGLTLLALRVVEQSARRALAGAHSAPV